MEDIVYLDLHFKYRFDTIYYKSVVNGQVARGFIPYAVWILDERTCMSQ